LRIREIRAVGLRGATPEGGWTEEIKPQDSVHTLIAVLTDEDLVGLGSVFNNVDVVRSALWLLEPLYRSENALEPERVTEKLRQNTFWFGRGGAITHTISGIDIALWDLLGKATCQPDGRLLGGRYRERVKPYASLLMREPAVLAERLLQLKDEGFRAFKIGWGAFGRQSPKYDEEIVRAAREAVGSDALLMVDAGASDAFWRQSYKWALRTSSMLADYDVAWFEEPLKPDSLEDYVQLRLRASVPIAGGEVLTRRQSFQPWLRAGALDIVQPDVTKVGGITESRRIAWMAEEHGVRFIPHGWNTAVGLAADLQLASALPDTDLVEYLTGSPYIDEIVTDGCDLPPKN
jgi:D-galactarolactone cycloisomerase